MKRSDLTLDERYLIQHALLSGLTQKEIAKMLRRDPSTISNELKIGRRHRRGAYCPHRAQRRRDRARAKCGLNAISKPATLWLEVKRALKAGMTPQEIAGRLARLNAPVLVSAQAIYDHIHRHQWQGWLTSFKRRKHLKRPARRPWNGRAAPIKTRTQDADLRIEFGHFEVDSMVGKRNDKKRLVVVVERQTLYTLLVRVKHLNAMSVAKKLRHRLEHCGLPFLSLTSDRGWEFTALADVMPCKVYVCDAYCPNQRGTNENQIGRLRVDLQKGMSIDRTSDARLKRIEHKHNHTPRAALDFYTPYEIAFKCPPLSGICT